MDLQIARATRADRATVIATIVAAFADDPAFLYFFPDEQTFAEHATALAGYLFDKRVDAGGVSIAEGGAVAALWDPPSRADSEDDLDLPRDAVDRIERYDGEVTPLLPPQPYWYLGVLATHPAHAGRRLGRRLMAAGVAVAHAEGVPAVLETMNPSNVELYRREGWQVVGHTDGELVPTTWVLVNEA